MREEVKAESVECFFCNYLFDSDKGVAGHACAAYPFGIPDDILIGIRVHQEVQEDQFGKYVFDPQ